MHTVKRTFRILKLNQRQNFHLSAVMPKNKKKAVEPKSKESSAAKISAIDNVKGAVYLGCKNEIILKIHAKPGAKESAVTDVGNEAIGVQIAAPPIDGEANKELIRYLAEILKLRKSDLSLDKGSRSKEKTVVISKDVLLTDVIAQLNAVSKQ